MWRGDVPTERNPMELVSVKDATKRTRHPGSLTVEQFQQLLAQFRDDLCFRTILLLAVSFGLRVSEALGLKWKDIDWLGKTLRIERGVVKQIVDDVKSANSAKTRNCRRTSRGAEVMEASHTISGRGGLDFCFSSQTWAAATQLHPRLGNAR